jgi:outer membrane protein assembly factor BamB
MKKIKNLLFLLSVIVIVFYIGHDTLITNAATTVTTIKQTYQQNSSTSKQMSTLKGYSKSKKLIWTYKTEWVIQTELENISPYFKNGNFVYIVADGKVIALDLNTGKVKWKTKNIAGASIHYAFDKKGTLYIGGFYGPDIVAINKKGKVLWTVKDASKGKTYWPIEINLLTDKIEIIYDTNTRYNEKTETQEDYYGSSYIDYSGNILNYTETVLQ